MDRSLLQAIMLAGVKQVQEDSGRTWRDLTESSKVIGTLDGFESINGIEATCVVERLVIESGLGSRVSAETLFVNGRRALTVGEAVDVLAKTIISEA
jgi:hypothetical protein